MKRNYAAERREAARYADWSMRNVVMPQPGHERRLWLARWGWVYEAYISGIRRRARLGEPRE